MILKDDERKEHLLFIYCVSIYLEFYLMVVVDLILHNWFNTFNIVFKREK